MIIARSKSGWLIQTTDQGLTASHRLLERLGLTRQKAINSYRWHVLKPALEPVNVNCIFMSDLKEWLLTPPVALLSTVVTSVRLGPLVCFWRWYAYLSATLNKSRFNLLLTKYLHKFTSKPPINPVAVFGMSRRFKTRLTLIPYHLSKSYHHYPWDDTTNFYFIQTGQCSR